MPSEDAIRWNQRYREDASRYSSPRTFLVENSGYLPQHGLALDIAMGLGANAAYLTERGLQVVGVDISDIAVQSAHSQFPQVQPILADLTNLTFAPHSFDVIINFYYLQRNLWQDFRKILRPNGVLILETLTQEMTKIKPDIDTAYLLAPGELHDLFRDWTILVYREGWQTAQNGSQKAVASLVARPPVPIKDL